jgi:ribosomal protein L11 methylase PrmA
MSVERIPGSFRDPSGQVYRSGNRILRALHGEAAREFRAFALSRCAAELRERGWLVGFEELSQSGSLPSADLWVEHPRLTAISHPYEWPFELLREAAMFHLDVQLAALAHGFKLRDASAYNVQFDRRRPVFIDLPSFAQYVEGEHWLGHRQFCEQFLNPLLLRSRVGVPHHAWYRGSPDGIPTADLYELCGWRDWLSPRHLAHILLPVRLQRWAARRPASVTTRAAARPLPRTALRALLEGMRSWIAALAPRGHDQTTWSGYETDNTYEAAARETKHRLIREFAAAHQPAVLLDVGCNSGEYSELGLGAGAREVVGIDIDVGALDAACERGKCGKLPFLPLYVDASNPTPGQGWRHQEYPGFAERVRADAVLALAVAHHLALGKNIPLAEVVATLVRLAPRGLIEFVPLDDPTAQRMLAFKRDLFPDYGEGSFRAALEAVARIVAVTPVTASGRIIFEYERDAD